MPDRERTSPPDFPPFAALLAAGDAAKAVSTPPSPARRPRPAESAPEAAAAQGPEADGTPSAEPVRQTARTAEDARPFPPQHLPEPRPRRKPDAA